MGLTPQLRARGLLMLFPHLLLPIHSVSPTAELYALFLLTALRELNILASLPISPATWLVPTHSFKNESYEEGSLLTRKPSLT